MILLAFALAISSFLFVSNASATWWNSTLTNCRNITVNNTQNSNVLTNYQVPVNLSFTTGVSNYADVRFINDSCNGASNAVQLSSWQENYTSTYDYEWVKADSIPASGLRNISVYYTNTTPVSSVSNGTNVFIFFDSFDTYSNSAEVNNTGIWGSLKGWNTPNNINRTAYATSNSYFTSPNALNRSYVASDQSVEMWLATNMSNSDNYIAEYVAKNASNSFAGLSGNTADTVGFEFNLNKNTSINVQSAFQALLCGVDSPENMSFVYANSVTGEKVIATNSSTQCKLSSTDYHLVQLKVNSSNVYQMYAYSDWHQGSTINSSLTVSNSSYTSGFFTMRFGTLVSYIDDFRIRNYTRIEPTYTLGSQETGGGSDTTPPTFSNYNANTTVANAKVNFSITISDETALSGYIFSTNNTGTWVNYTWTSLASGGLAQNITALNSTVGVLVNVSFWANDSSNNWAKYNASLTTTSDSTPPTWANYSTNTTNNTNIKTGSVITFAANWNDNVNLSMSMNSTAINGTWTNGSWSNNFAASLNWTNYTMTYPASAMGGNFAVKIYANDTTNNQNATGIWYWYNTTAAAVSCGDTITSNTTLANDLTGCTGNGLTIGANSITLDCNGHWINATAPSQTSGIVLDGRSYVTLENCNIYNFSDTCIHMHAGPSHNYLFNNTLLPNGTLHGTGIHGLGATYNTINYTTESGGEAGSGFGSGAHDNIFTNNIWDNNTFNWGVAAGTYGMHFSTAYNNIVINDTSRNNGDYNIGPQLADGAYNNTWINITSVKANGGGWSVWEGYTGTQPDHFINFTMGPIMVAFIPQGVNITNASAPATDPSGYANISKYFNATVTSTLYINVSYGTEPANESRLLLARYNGTWELNSAVFSNLNGVDTANNVVYANITGTGNNIYAVLENTTSLGGGGDTTPPIVTISSPTNSTYNSTSVWANATLNEAGSWCGRSLDGGANTTMTNSTGNWNNQMTSLSEGGHNVRFYCNDTSGNMNGSASNTIYFSVDTTPPIVNVSSPTNNTYSASSLVWHNVTLNEAGSWCGVSINGTANQTLANSTGNYNLLEILGNSTYNARFYCNDTYGNMNGSVIVYYTVAVPPAPPPTCGDSGLCGIYPNCYSCGGGSPTCADSGQCGTYPDCYTCAVSNITYSADQEVCGNLDGYSIVTVLSNINLTVCKYNGTAGTGYWNVSAASIYVYGNINASYRGWNASLGPGAGNLSSGFAIGGYAYGTPNYFDIDMGSGGASGCTGGMGGGAITLNASNSLFVNGTLRSNGGSAVTQGGGGSGGGILLIGSNVNINSCTINVNGGLGVTAQSCSNERSSGAGYGGNGGNASDVGGGVGAGGSGGRIKIFYHSFSNTSSTVTATKGAGGGAGGNNGNDGTILYQEMPFIEINTYDEQTYANITYNVTISNTTSSQTFSNQNISRQEISTLPQGEVTITVTSDGYIPRTYYELFSPSISNIFLNAYLLQTGQGVYITTLVYSTSLSNVIAGATVTASKFINGSWTDVSEVQTDSQGKGYLYLYPYIYYQVEATYMGQSSGTINYYPNPNYVLYINLTSGGGEIPQVNVTSYSHYYWYFYPQGGIYNDTTLIPLNFSYIDNNALTSIFGYNVVYNGSVIDSESISANSGNIDTVSINTSGRTGIIKVDAYANRVYAPVAMSYYFTIIPYSNATEGFNIGQVITDVSVPSPGYHPYTDIAGFIIIAIAIAFLSRLPWHIQGAGIFGYVVLGILIYIGWIQLSPNSLFNWGGYMGIGILLVSILYLRGGF